MATVQVEISDDGKVGTLPEPLQKLLDTRIDEAYGKGAAKAAKELEGEIAKLKKSGLDPVERERLKTLEADHSRLTEEIALRDKKFDEAQEIRNKRHQQELADRDAKLSESAAEIQKRTQRIQELVGKEIRAAAMAAGARAESLDELELLLSGRVGLDNALQAFVKDANDAGKPLLDKDQKPVSIEGLVVSYLTDHPHHKAAPLGRGAGGGGGRSLGGKPSGDAEKDAALAAVAEQPTIANVARAFSRIGRSA